MIKPKVGHGQCSFKCYTYILHSWHFHFRGLWTLNMKAFEGAKFLADFLDFFLLGYTSDVCATNAHDNSMTTWANDWVFVYSTATCALILCQAGNPRNWDWGLENSQIRRWSYRWPFDTIYSHYRCRLENRSFHQPYWEAGENAGWMKKFWRFDFLHQFQEVR